ncbi:MAG: transposase [Microcoleus sp. SU_5_6]|nr:transposase [Microcoleus sp. SU_5_6]NJL66973.1 transposase [Microcoleus sp. SM1_3_4]
MKHRRKSRSKKFDGYKRHILKDLDTGMVRAVGVTPANAAEASVTEALAIDLASQNFELEELHIDRAPLTSHWVKERSAKLTIICKSWRVRNGKYFEKTAFNLDWDESVILYPNGISIPLLPEKW